MQMLVSLQSGQKLLRDAMGTQSPGQKWFAHLCYMV